MWSREHGPCLYGKKNIFLRTTLIHTFRCILIQYQPFCSFWWILKCTWVRWPAVMSRDVSWQSKTSWTWAMDHESEFFVLRIAPVSAIWFWHHPGQVAFPVKKSKYVNPVHPSKTSNLDEADNDDLGHILNSVISEANNQNLPPDGYYGGLILDEMAIEEDLQMVRNGKFTKMIDFADCGVESSLMQAVRSDLEDKSLQNYVLLIQFLGITGLRFPVAHFPTTHASATDIYRFFLAKMCFTFGFIWISFWLYKFRWRNHPTGSSWNYTFRLSKLHPISIIKS